MAQVDLFRMPKRPWNTGRIIGAKPPFKPKHIWGIRQQLRISGKVRDLALFNLAIDSISHLTPCRPKLTCTRQLVALFCRSKVAVRVAFSPALISAGSILAPVSVCASIFACSCPTGRSRCRI